MTVEAKNPNPNDAEAGAEKPDVATDVENLGGGLGGAETDDADAEIETIENGAESPEASGEDGEPEPGEAESEEVEAKPDSADGYELVVPDDIEWPNNIELKIDPDSEMAKSIREVAFEEGLSQKALNRLLKLHLLETATNLGEITKVLRTNTQAEIAKIGEDRIAQVDNALRAHLGKEVSAKLFPVLSTAASYEAMEIIVEMLNAAPGGNRPPTKGSQPAGERLKGRELLDHVFSKGE